MTSAKPSLELLRELSDEHVLRALMDETRLTRAELATRTGISKPTVGESVRRLEAAGVVVDTGARTTGRGRAGSYYALAGDIGCALAVSIAPEGITAEIVDARGAVLARGTERVRRPVRTDRVTASVREAVHAGPGQAPARRSGWPWSAPPARWTGSPAGCCRCPTRRSCSVSCRRPRRWPASPTGRFWSTTTSTGLRMPNGRAGRTTVQAEQTCRPNLRRPSLRREPDRWTTSSTCISAKAWAAPSSATARSAGGTAASPARSLTWSPPGRAAGRWRSSTCSATSGVRHPDSTAIDVDALTSAVTGPGGTSRATREVLATAVSGVVSAAVTLTDPAVVVVGGPWGTNPVILEAVRAAVDRLARPVTLRPALVTGNAPLAGARTQAIHDLRSAITRYRQTLRRHPLDREA